ncbi:ribosome small subunit-dependent GTPase A [Pararhizobium sp. IMCC21322]|uniref:ribosome small subunit-dependent GTPase A n=1 Tax=Pararhizobium sp. IMCC21322 TaxID=3067903 RepID=UPI00274099EC|nr:ribosome small subunit-dependent GTPase A [Pararhizobium sp. IMCC21322]
MNSLNSDLENWGWNSFFAEQLAEIPEGIPVRVVEVHRSGIRIVGPSIDEQIPRFSTTQDDEESVATVGDWLLLEEATHRPIKLLTRRSLFHRRAPGKARKLQLIAANIDTLFIVTSCNQDFNIARLERYLALAGEADVLPVIVLTKADQTSSPEKYLLAAANLGDNLQIEIVDARSAESVARLAKWCGRGQTVALVGSSGVGKSTLVNALCGNDRAATGAVREGDDKGRHTTSGRTFYQLPSGGWLLDTPGIRELQLAEVKEGLEQVFSDVLELAAQCRFNDCKHDTEPGCRVQAALKDGTLTPDRLNNWRKLAAEEVQNTESLSERHTKNRAFTKMEKRAVKHKKDHEEI